MLLEPLLLTKWKEYRVYLHVGRSATAEEEEQSDAKKIRGFEYLLAKRKKTLNCLTQKAKLISKK